MGTQDSWWTIPVASFVVVSAVSVLSYTEYGRTHTDTYTQTPMNAILPRLLSAWVIKKNIKSIGLNGSRNDIPPVVCQNSWAGSFLSSVWSWWMNRLSTYNVKMCERNCGRHVSLGVQYPGGTTLSAGVWDKSSSTRLGHCHWYPHRSQTHLDRTSAERRRQRGWEASKVAPPTSETPARVRPLRPGRRGRWRPV